MSAADHHALHQWPSGPPTLDRDNISNSASAAESNSAIESSLLEEVQVYMNLNMSSLLVSLQYASGRRYSSPQSFLSH